MDIGCQYDVSRRESFPINTLEEDSHAGSYRRAELDGGAEK